MRLVEYLSEPLMMLLSLIFWAILGLFSHGCGPTARDTAQIVLNAQASGLVVTTDDRVEFYRDRDAMCSASSSSMSQWRECMEPAYVLARAADAYDHTLRGAQAVLQAEGAEGLQGKLPCLVAAATELAEAAAAVDVKLPADVGQILSLATSVAGECTEE